MLKDLLKDGGLYTLANFLTKGISLLLIPLYTSYFSPSDYGVIDILVIFGLLISSFSTLQLSQSVARYISEQSTNDHDKKLISSTGLWIVIIISTVTAILLSASSNYITNLLSTDTIISKNTFILAIIAVAFSNVYQYNNVHLRFLRYTKSFAIISIIYGLLNICFTIFYVLVLDKGINGYFYGVISPYPLILIVQFIILKKEILFTINYTFLKKLLKYSLPLIPAAIAYIVLNFTDRVFINEYLGTADVGIYGIASKFSTVVSIIILSISAALGPIVFERHLKAESKKELEKVLQMFFIGGALFVLILSLFSFETLFLFTNEKYYEAKKIMPILYMSVYFSGFSMFSIGLQIKEKTKTIGLFVLFSAALNILLNYLLVSNFGLYGAAFSTLISIGFNTITLFFFSQKHYKINLPLIKFLITLVILFITTYIGVKIEEQFESYWITLMGRSIVLLVFFLYLWKVKLLEVLIKK
jgi:O-antigen/teichoic acid export membrane protein